MGADAPSFSHSNCVKCGLFIEVNPEKHEKRNPNENALFFVCSSSPSHRHCLCWECGLLYGLADKTQTAEASENGSDQNAENENENENGSEHSESGSNKAMKWRNSKMAEEEGQ